MSFQITCSLLSQRILAKAMFITCAYFAFALPAHGVVKGREGGPLSGSSLMILNAKGGMCSGLVIAPGVVLTAGHCVAGGLDIRVHYRDRSGQPALITPVGIALHPEYRANAAANRQRSVDMALVRVSETLPGFSAAPLSAVIPRSGESITVAGFGISTEQDARSTGVLRSTQLSVVEPYGPGKILLWAADSTGRGKVPGAGACQGDSGGAMITQSGHAVAVTSWSTGHGSDRCGLLTQGTLIGPQRLWLDQSLAKWGQTANWFTTR